MEKCKGCRYFHGSKFWNLKCRYCVNNTWINEPIYNNYERLFTSDELKKAMTDAIGLNLSFEEVTEYIERLKKERNG